MPLCILKKLSFRLSSPKQQCRGHGESACDQ